MDPYQNGGLYQKYIETVVEPMQRELPFETNQMELPFDQTAVEGLGRAITPYRWASYLQDAVVQYISTMDYTFGASERWDIVQDIVSDRMERAATNEERMDLEDALQIWHRTYGNGAR